MLRTIGVIFIAVSTAIPYSGSGKSVVLGQLAAFALFAHPCFFEFAERSGQIVFSKIRETMDRL